MGNKNVANHIHRYKKVNLSRDKENPYFVYKCTKPACSHYLPLDLAEGKMTECNVCNSPFLIAKEQLTRSGGKAMTRPRCTDCIKRKNTKEVEMMAEFLKGKV